MELKARGFGKVIAAYEIRSTGGRVLQRWIWIFVLILTPLMLNAQGKSVSQKEGKTTSLKEAFAQKEISYEYFPVDKVFWDRVNLELDQKNYKSVVYLGVRQEKAFGAESDEGAEAQLVLAKGLIGAKLIYAAQAVLTRLSEDKIGTRTGEAALSMLSDLTLSHEFDRESLRVLMDTNVFVGLHPTIQSFVGFQKHVIDLQDGYKDWASIHLRSIKSTSQWGYLLSYWRAIAKVAENQMPSATLRLDELAKVTDLHPNTKDMVALQRARLMFERGEFEDAENMYSNLGIKGIREFGRVQLERAWTQFYLKNYSKSLGILAALRAPPFLPSLHPERYVLEMIILKQLCHYNEVRRVGEGFDQIFESALKAIRARKPLRTDPVLHNMSLMNLSLQRKANLIDQMRREKQRFVAMGLDDLNFSQNFLDSYAKKDLMLQEQLNLELEPEARRMANELLIVEEEVDFLKYTSRLDGLRIIQRGEGRSYKSSRVSYLTFEKIYWLVDDNEYWWNELPDYYTLISSRCSEQDLEKSADFDEWEG